MRPYANECDYLNLRIQVYIGVQFVGGGFPDAPLPYSQSTQYYMDLELHLKQ